MRKFIDQKDLPKFDSYFKEILSNIYNFIYEYKYKQDTSKNKKKSLNDDKSDIEKYKLITHKNYC